MGPVMKQLIVTGVRQAEFEEVEQPACGATDVLVRSRTTAISTGTELRVYRAIPVDDEGKYLHEWVPFEFPWECDTDAAFGGALTLLQVKLSFDAGDNLRDFLGEQKGAKDFQKGQEAWTGKQDSADTAAGQKR